MLLIITIVIYSMAALVISRENTCLYRVYQLTHFFSVSPKGALFARQIPHSMEQIVSQHWNPNVHPGQLLMAFLVQVQAGRHGKHSHPPFLLSTLCSAWLGNTQYHGLLLFLSHQQNYDTNIWQPDWDFVQRSSLCFHCRSSLCPWH